MIDESSAAYELIPLLLIVLLIAVIAISYSIWCDIGGDDEDAIPYDVGKLNPYSKQEWQRHDLP